jgi:membrane protease YdiL (CAAX protease family)
MISVADWFIGTDRKLRPLWRATIYFVLTFVALPFAFDPGVAAIIRWTHMSLTLTPELIVLGEVENFLMVLIATGVFAWYERRRIDSYGMPIAQALGRRTWEGVLAGVVLAGGVALGMILLGGMQVHGLALGGGALAYFALVWLIAMVLVGVVEEFWFRAYFLQTLWNAIGFWPASIVIAAIFAGIHYFFKQGENVWDVITLVWFNLLICYSVLKTGTLWFAVGLHFAFDYMQFFVIGTPNGSAIPVGRLLNVTFNGPAWLTGGVLGTEASLLMYPLLALLTFYVWWRDPPADPKRPA